MALLETEALVLRTYNFGEADKIVVCLTRSAGLIRAVAKGCRKLKSRFGAALEPFTLAKITYYQKEHQELVSLNQAEILKSHFDLSGDAETLTGLAYMGDLVIEFSPPYEPNERLFRMLKACLDAISESQSDLQIILRGGYYYLRQISQAFSDVVFIDTSSYMKTMKRRRLDWTPGEKKHWRSAMTATGEPLDELLQKNADTFNAILSLHLQKGQFTLPFVETNLLH